MRTIIFTLLTFFLLSVASIDAQVAETEAPMSDGTQAALIVEYNVDAKKAEKMWKSYVKKIGKIDWDRKNREHMLFNKVVPDIDKEYPVTIITKFEDNKATFWFKMDDEYLNSDNDQEELKGAGRFLQQYAYQVERQSVGDLLENEEDDLKDFEKNLKKLVKKKDKLDKEIQKAKDKIAKAESEIEQNLQDQEDTSKAIAEQKEKVSTTSKKLSEIGKN